MKRTTFVLVLISIVTVLMITGCGKSKNVWTIVEDNGTEEAVDFGDKLCIGKKNPQCFYVYKIEGNNLKMIAEWNLNVKNTMNSAVEENIQHESIKGYKIGSPTYGNIAFSDSAYWASGVDQIDLTNTNNQIYPYLELYKNKLMNDYGVNLADSEITLIKNSELNDASIGCDEENRTCEKAPSWIKLTSYWTASASDDHHGWCVSSTGSFKDYVYYDANGCGIRPVITIENPFKIIFHAVDTK